MAYAEILPGENLIQVSTTWLEGETIKKVPGKRWNGTRKFWTVPLTWTACIQLRGVFGQDLHIGDNLRLWAFQEKKSVQNRMDIREDTAAPGWAGNPNLYEYQRAGVYFLTQGSALLGDEMGTGKTIQMLETLRMQEDSLPALVICPNSVKRNWGKEAKKWLPTAVPYVVEGTATNRAKLLAAAAKDPKALVIINFESVRLHSRTAGFGSIALTAKEEEDKDLNKIPFRTTVVDEAHRIKDPNSKQTRAIWAAASTSIRRYALTGTPLANNPSDLWAIMHFVSPDDFPAKSAFVDRYCETSFNGWGGLVIDGIHKENKDEFYKIFDPFFRCTPKALVLPQLPPKVRVTWEVELSPKSKKAYDQLAAAGIARLDDGSLLLSKADIATQTRLLQFSSAYMEQVGTKLNKKTGEMEPVFEMRDPSPKIDLLMEWLEANPGKQVAVAAEHSQLIRLAEKRLDLAGITYAKITGDVAQWDRDIQLQHFQEGKLQVILFTIKAGGVGLTMTAADTIIFLQRSWSMLENLQTEDRVHRIGAEVHQKIMIIDMITRGTIEEDQIARLIVKAERLEEITRTKARLAAEGISTAALDKEIQDIMNSDLLGTK